MKEKKHISQALGSQDNEKLVTNYIKFYQTTCTATTTHSPWRGDFRYFSFNFLTPFILSFTYHRNVSQKCITEMLHSTKKDSLQHFFWFDSLSK